MYSLSVIVCFVKTKIASNEVKQGVHVVVRVTEVILGRQTSVQCVAYLQCPVKGVLLEGSGVLVVMIPCADAAFWNDHDAEVIEQQPRILNSEIQSQIVDRRHI